MNEKQGVNKTSSPYAATYKELLGISDHIKKINKKIKTAAMTEKNVLIQGPTGTGKEIVANNIHWLSNRKKCNFIQVIVASLTDDLRASSLYGHVKGSFTGASDNRVGYFEAADGGTLFFDEIGELSKGAQVDLLSFIQSRNFTQVGRTTPKSVNVRIIAATNRNLREEITKGNFREDLFYRLNEYPINTSSLRDNVEDLVFLINKLSDKKIDHLKRFLLYYFPYEGNVRELISLIEHDERLLFDELELRMETIENFKKAKNTHLSKWKVECLRAYNEMKQILEGNFQAQMDQLFFLRPDLDESAKLKLAENNSMWRGLINVSEDEHDLVQFSKNKYKDVIHATKQFIRNHSQKRELNNNFKLNVIEWCTELFEILTLKRNKKISHDKIVKILQIRRAKLTDKVLREYYGIVLDDDDSKEFHFPHDVINCRKIFHDVPPVLFF